MNTVHEHPYWRAVRERNADAELDQILRLWADLPRSSKRWLRDLVAFYVWLDGKPICASPLYVIGGALQVAWDCLCDPAQAAYWARKIHARLVLPFSALAIRWLRDVAAADLQKGM